MKNLNPLNQILQESKKYKKLIYGDNFKKHKKLIQDAKKRREQISLANGPSKVWPKGTDFMNSPLGKAATLSDRKSALRGMVSDRTMKKARELRVLDPKKLIAGKKLSKVISKIVK